MFKITEFNIAYECDQCGIELKDQLTIEDINTSKYRYHLCQDCKNKIQSYGGESIKVQSRET